MTVTWSRPSVLDGKIGRIPFSSLFQSSLADDFQRLEDRRLTGRGLFALRHEIQDEFVLHLDRTQISKHRAIPSARLPGYVKLGNCRLALQFDGEDSLAGLGVVRI